MSLQDSFTTGAYSLDGTEVWNAMTFKASANYSCDVVQLAFYINPANTGGTLRFELWGTDGSDLPLSTNVLATATPTVDVVDITAIWQTDPEQVLTFTLDTPVDLTKNESYALVIISDNASAVRWSTSQGLSDEYTNGVCYKSSNGTAWPLNGTNRDVHFWVYGDFNISGVTPVDLQHTKKLVAAGNDQIWHESSSGTMEVLADSIDDLSCSDPLSMFEAYGKVFVTNDTNLKVANFQDVKITTADIGSDPPDPDTVLTGGTSGAVMVVSYITALSSACDLYGLSISNATFASGETVTGTDDDGNAISFVLNSSEADGPHWYDWTVFGNDASFGALPERATLGCNYRGRAVVSGNPNAPHQWYMSRQAGTHDFLYGINDAQSAVAGNNADAGEIGDIVTSLISYKDDWLIVGCASTIWYFTGDPTNGGSLDELDLTTGIFGAQSWCWGKGNDLYFWGMNGIYKVSLPGNSPVCVSEIRLPALVEDEGVSPETHRITMSYDKRRAGIVVNISELAAGGDSSSYFYDLRTDGFFPESTQSGGSVFSSEEYDAIDKDYKHVMYGCRDGYIRTYDNAAKDDDDTTGTAAISSYVTFGPFLLSDFASNEGKITGLDIILGGGGAGGSQADSDGVTYELYTAKSAEKVVELMAAGSPVRAAGTITGPGRDRKTFRKKIRGVYGGIRIKNATASQTWALEQLLIGVKKAGGLR